MSQKNTRVKGQTVILTSAVSGRSAGKPRPVSMPVESFSGGSDSSFRPGVKGRKGKLNQDQLSCSRPVICKRYRRQPSVRLINGGGRGVAGGAACFECLSGRLLTRRAAAASTRLLLTTDQPDSRVLQARCACWHSDCLHVSADA